MNREKLTDRSNEVGFDALVMPTKKTETVIFDLDGTLALIDHRRHLVTGKNKNWDEFYLACTDDKPNQPIIRLCNLLADAGYKIRILSGRGFIAFEETLRWILNNKVKYDSIWMRDIDDFTPDEELKKQWLNKIRIEYGEEVVFVFDDRSKVVDMWRNEGLTCLQVAKGDF